MTREEILEKSKKENRGSDPYENESMEWASAWAYTFGWGIVIIFNILSLIFNNKLDFSVLAVGTGMCFMFFLLKFIRMRKRHELFVTLCYGLLFAVSIFCYVKSLIG